MAGALRYLAADDVRAAMPPVDERLRLAERTMTALVADAELPPKLGVHPRPPGAFAHAMPAYLRGPAADGSTDLLGLKWVTGSPGNRRAGLPAIHAVVVLNDPHTGEPTALLDGAEITAHRTAAVSGVAIARFGPGANGEGRGAVEGGPWRAALIGAGVQGHSHLEVLGHVLPGLTLVVHDRHPERAADLAAAARRTAGIAEAITAPSARAATDGADVVITAVSFAAAERRQVMTPDWLASDALVVAVDYATMCGASVATEARLFLVDERGQFLANREAGQFDGYPDPTATLGEAILAGTPRPTQARVLVTHLGVGLADLVFGDAIVHRALERGLGIDLAR